MWLLRKGGYDSISFNLPSYAVRKYKNKEWKSSNYTQSKK